MSRQKKPIWSTENEQREQRENVIKILFCLHLQNEGIKIVSSFCVQEFYCHIKLMCVRVIRFIRVFEVWSVIRCHQWNEISNFSIWGETQSFPPSHPKKTRKIFSGVHPDCRAQNLLRSIILSDNTSSFH